MAKIVWDKVGDRFYQTGVQNGVIYLEDGRYAPWNGLTSVSEGGGEAPTAVYFDGHKVSDLTKPSDFSATVNAITYPEELYDLQGFGVVSSGVYLGEQQPERFNMSYQTLVGSDLTGDAGYKIHILYNVVLTPSDATFNSISGDSDITEFSWTLTTVPEEVEGFQPTSHIVMDSRKANPTLLAQVELLLYGGITANPVFPTFQALTDMLLSYYIIEIVDNKDGTWTAVARGDYIDLEETREFEITGIDATYLDAGTYEASSTLP
jgi:hypothetical protein